MCARVRVCDGDELKEVGDSARYLGGTRLSLLLCSERKVSVFFARLSLMECWCVHTASGDGSFVSLIDA